MELSCSNRPLVRIFDRNHKVKLDEIANEQKIDRRDLVAAFECRPDINVPESYIHALVKTDVAYVMNSSGETVTRIC